MKITNRSDATPPPEQGKAKAAHAGEAGAAEGGESPDSRGATSFASILSRESVPERADEGERAARPRDGGGHGGAQPGGGARKTRPGGEEKEQAADDEGADARAPSARQLKPEPRLPEATGQPASYWARLDYVPSPARSEEAPKTARDILRAGDLERIISSVRTEVTPGGGREVTIKLSQSVLEGLRIKLSADPAGRITAEFVSGDEQVRRQIDARAPELAALLRSRGINLAALKTSSDSSGFQQQGDPPDERGRRSHAPGVAPGSVKGVAGPAPAAREDEAADEPPVEEPKTYLA